MTQSSFTQHLTLVYNRLNELTKYRSSYDENFGKGLYNEIKKLTNFVDAMLRGNIKSELYHYRTLINCVLARIRNALTRQYNIQNISRKCPIYVKQLLDLVVILDESLQLHMNLI